METLLATIELDWPDDIRADANRRLARIARALRHAPETSERLLDISLKCQAAAEPAVVSLMQSPSITNQPWAAA